MATEKIVLITGGAGGVGKATAAQFLKNGDRILLADMDVDRLQQTSIELIAFGGEVKTLLCDVTQVSNCEDAVKEAVSHFGRLDILVNTAGVWVEGRAEKTTEEEWDWCLDVNLKGTFFMCAKAIPELKKTQGCIINIASDAGLHGIKNTSVYCASKAGVVNMTKALAIDLAEDLVRVNAVCPSDIMTPMLEYQSERYGGGDPQGYLDDLIAMYPQGKNARFLQPEEVAEVVFYLASDAAKGITGATIPIDFGVTAGLW